MLVSVCKKKTKYIYDKDRNVVEQMILPLNFTIDMRFMNPKTAANFYHDVNNNFFYNSLDKGNRRESRKIRRRNDKILFKGEKRKLKSNRKSIIELPFQCSLSAIINLKYKK